MPRAQGEKAPSPAAPRTAPCTPAREFKKPVLYSSTDIGDGGGGRRRAFAEFSSYVVRKAPPLERKVECTLEELCSGCKKEVKYTRDVVAKNGLVSKKEETKTIRVKPGWKKGMKVTFEGMGDERPGCLPGDAVFTISEKKHKVFKRKGNDLVLKAEVPLVSALTGWSFSFRLIGGEKMSFAFRDEVISPGYEKVVAGEGMPVAGGETKGARGDLRVKFDVVFPKNLTGEQRAGLASILRACP
uniref:Chaperone DnaJ C-terminal domain-containing protein n=1 Tax=Oryza punctata TaxID=4537 RepID=A0A0E0L2U8_ORYPU